MKKPTLSFIMGLYSSLLIKIYIFLRQIEFPLDALDRYIPPKANIIDLGCGVGSIDIYLALKEKERKILGLELDKNRVKAARAASSRIKNLSFENKDITELDKLSPCDVILLIDVLHHVKRKAHYQILADCHAALKKGGILLVKEIDNRPRWKYWYNYFQDKIMTLNGSLYFISPRDMVNLLTRVGFVTETHKFKTWELNPTPQRIYICRK